MPNLSWLGKDKVVTYHQKVAYHFLEKKFSIGNSDNKIIHGDNLIALKSLLPRYENKIKCIYIDPPYNTGNENWIYNDNVSDPRLQRWIGEVVGKEGEDLTRHDKWLCMMYPRLRLLQKLLADDGAIFISIDDNELFYLKCICDEIFGASNFIANFSWKRKKEISNDSNNVSIQGEYILCYRKNIQMQLNSEPLSDEYIKKSYKKPTKEFPLDFWRPVPITVSKGLSGGGYRYKITTPTGAEHEKIWAYPQKSYEELLTNNRIYFGKDGNAIPQRVMYLSESKGKPTTNYWDNVATNKDGKKEILSIFDGDNIFTTPKPTALIEKILQLATNKNSIVLDSFAGSGTTAHAVINLNKQDGGNRKFILIEIEDYAENITAERVKRVGGSFNFYEIGESLFDEDGFINDAVPFERICEYIYFAETGKIFVPCDEKNLMGVDDDTAYYYFGGENLSWTTLSKIKTRAKIYVIYADACNLSEDEMMKYNIHFRQIPFDVRRY